jgi:hypothetical protein
MGSLLVPVTASAICRTWSGVRRPMPEFRHLLCLSRASAAFPGLVRPAPREPPSPRLPAASQHWYAVLFRSQGGLQRPPARCSAPSLSAPVLFSAVFSVYFVRRISEAAMGGPSSSVGGGGGGVQRSSIGCSIAQKGAPYPDAAA